MRRPVSAVSPGRGGSGQRTALDLAIEKALLCTLHADSGAFDRLPVPIRLRAAGAVQAWRDARRIAGPHGVAFRSAVADPAYRPDLLCNPLAELAGGHGTARFDQETNARIADACADSVFVQAFWERNGVLYEPTPALHRLLHTSDIAADVPLHMMCPSVPALFIIPDRASWRDGEVEAIAVFTHGRWKNDAPAPGRVLSFVTWRRWVHPEPSWAMGVVNLAVPEDNRTISQALDLAALTPPQRGPAISREQARAEWLPTLDYVAKMLLYLSLDDVPVQLDLAYSAAPRVFSGLGRRKRELRQAEIEQLYDRYVVGPTQIANWSGAHSEEIAGHSHLPAHWRRGHLRMQAHGPRSSLRKIMLIRPTLVRADRLEAGSTPAPRPIHANPP
ncbi:hypothetical protein [Variovorax rhizosphaerae]|uniref:Uncharacterized protein n=1 Tax=Variovorax rhizosphaerae TaxID=1836200 RepID=A0ABU8WFM3_9BURK